MKRRWIAALGFSMMLAMMGVIGAKAQNSPPGVPPPYTAVEYYAYNNLHGQKDLQWKLKLLEAFVANYPDSTLLPFVCQDYYTTYFALKDFPKSVEYVDKFFSVSGRFNPGGLLPASFARAYAYYLGCSDSAFHTPHAYIAVRDAAARGLLYTEELKNTPRLTEEQFAAQKKAAETVFNAVAGMAEAGLKDFSVDPCKDAPVLDLTALSPPGPPIGDPRVFDRIIERLQALDRQPGNQYGR